MCRGERRRVPCTESARSPERERQYVHSNLGNETSPNESSVLRAVVFRQYIETVYFIRGPRSREPAQLRQLWGTVWARGARGGARRAGPGARPYSIRKDLCTTHTSKGSVKLALIDINKLLSHLLTSNSPPIRISATTPVLAAAKALGLPAIPFRAPRQAYTVRIFLLSLGGSRRIPI